MHRSITSSFVGLAALGSLAIASPALACGSNEVHHPAAYDGRSAAELFQNSEYSSASIVGMWEFKFVAGGNVVDFGYVQWHSDGTELQNSGGRAPSTENFCMGVWKQTGQSRYHLNHFALSYDSAGALNAKVNIKEDVTVDPHGATYTGPFTLDVYDPTGATLLQHVAGQVTATRVAAY